MRRHLTERKLNLTGAFRPTRLTRLSCAIVRHASLGYSTQVSDPAGVRALF